MAKPKLMAFDAGGLAPAIVAHAKKNGQSYSGVIRKALEVYLPFDDATPLAVYFSASSEYGGFLKQAWLLSLISDQSYKALCSALWAAEKEVQSKLDVFFNELHPDKESPENFYERRNREQQRRWDEGDKESRLEDPPEYIAQFESFLESSFHFPDLIKAKHLLQDRNQKMTRRGRRVDLASPLENEQLHAFPVSPKLRQQATKSRAPGFKTE